MKRAMLFLLFSFTQARDGLVSLAPWMGEERPAPYAASKTQTIFTG
ncbi:MAG: hypothetical protein Q7U64_01775 [Desulfocapsaceae bacterium]|nr:hypothetical protein [Desulfocapsaceae bacterium]